MVQQAPAPSQVPEDSLIDLDDSQPVVSPEDSPKQHDSISQDQAYMDTLYSIKETDLPLYSIVCNGAVANALIDSGATGSYVGNQAAKTVLGKSVETAGSHTLTIDKQVTLALDAAGFKHSIDALCWIPSSMSFWVDVVVGTKTLVCITR